MLKLQKPEELAQLLKGYRSIFVGAFCNEPQTLMRWFQTIANDLTPMSLYMIITGSPVSYTKNLPEHIKLKPFLSSGQLRKYGLTDQVDYIPMNLSEIPNWIETSNEIDVAFIQVSPPNQNGYCNTGISVDVIPSLISSAKLVVAEINNRLPESNGETTIHISQLHALVEGDHELLTIKDGEGNEIEKAIANNVAKLIPDKATIQIGIGSLSNEIAKALLKKKDLGIHSGSLNSGMKLLIENNVVTNKFKEIDQGKTVITTVLGDMDLYRFIDKREDILLKPISYTHNAKVIGQLSNFYAINSALEVDLHGQINAEALGETIVAGVGGQLDFFIGARLSENGCRILALPSAAKNGEISKIKVKIDAVTSVKSEVDYVVTEYGIAELKGKSLKERQQALISIAHPNFREALYKSV